ncbi:hypothetical protein SteCoe_34533 [Stentor coeruleus]|uniref:NLE domain-containing protein n=1 Tax=Stentor coeruleus TaxID=5963 RepID=A0A1R2AUH9_9CILI|nr:hypothetical protein SteCoe_34533 [Stentor coeruleus]
MEVEVTFKTSLGQEWTIDGSYSINTDSKREDLQDIILHILQKSAVLMFTLHNQPLTNTLQELLTSQNLSTEGKIELEFFIQIPPLKSSGQANSGDWISSIQNFSSSIFVSNYSGYIQKFSNMNLDREKMIFTGPLKSFNINNETKLICAISKKGLNSILDIDFNIIASGNTEHAEKCVWNPSGSKFAIGLYSGKITICEINDNDGVIIQGNKKQHVDTKGITYNIIETCHTDLVSGVFWPSFETLITTSFDHNVHQVDLEKASISSSILCPRSVQCSDFSSNMVFCGFENMLINAYDCRNSGKIFSTCASAWVRTLKIVGNAMSVGLENGQVYLYDLRAFKTPTHVLPAHEGKVMALDGDSEFLYTGGADGCIQRFTFT